MAPAPKPVKARERNNSVGTVEKPDSRLLKRETGLAPENFPERRLLINWMLVLVMRKLAPIRDIESPACTPAATAFKSTAALFRVGAQPPCLLRLL